MLTKKITETPDYTLTENFGPDGALQFAVKEIHTATTNGVQNYDADWNLTSAHLETDDGKGYKTITDYGPDWSVLARTTITTEVGSDGNSRVVTESQENGIVTGRTIVTTRSDYTLTETFGPGGARQGAVKEIHTATTKGVQNYDADWNLTSAHLETDNGKGYTTVTDYGPDWSVLARTTVKTEVGSDGNSRVVTENQENGAVTGGTIVTTRSDYTLTETFGPGWVLQGAVKEIHTATTKGVQIYDGDWNLVSAHLVTDKGGGKTTSTDYGPDWSVIDKSNTRVTERDDYTLTEKFGSDGALLGAVKEIHTATTKGVQIYDGDWNLISAHLETDDGRGYTTTTDYGPDWFVISRTTVNTEVDSDGNTRVITRHIEDGAVTGGTIVTTRPDYTLTETFGPDWVRLGAIKEIHTATTNGVQIYDADFNLVSAQLETPNGRGTTVTEYGADWSVISKSGTIVTIREDYTLTETFGPGWTRLGAVKEIHTANTKGVQIYDANWNLISAHLETDEGGGKTTIRIFGPDWSAISTTILSTEVTTEGAKILIAEHPESSALTSIVNDRPDAADDSVVTNEDTAVVIDVLANDSDPDGDSLSITSIFAPDHGVITVNHLGTITYTPDPDYFGHDSFEYEVSDGKGGTNTATVSIDVLPVNDGPSAPTDNIVVTEEDTPSAPVPIGARDVESTSFTYSIPASAPPTSGSVSFIGDSFIYTPYPDANGRDYFEIIINDGTFRYARQDVEVIIIPVNDAPVAVGDSAGTDEDQTLQINAADLLANDSDIDGDPLSVVSVGNATNGTVSLDGTTVSFTPDPDFFGEAGFDYEVSDGNGGSDTAHVTVTVASVNDEPEFGSSSRALATLKSMPIAFTVEASDLEDDLHFFAAGAPSNGVVTDEGDGKFTYTPNPGFFGLDSFTTMVTDGNGGMDEQTTTVNVEEFPEGIDWRLVASDGWAGAVGGTGQIFGTDAVQSVKVLNAPGMIVFGPSFNGGEDFVYLTGNAADWLTVRSGSTAIFFDGDTCVSIPVGSEGMLVGFDDGNRILVFDMETNSVRIGDQALTDTLVPVSAPAEDFDGPVIEDDDARARLFLAEGASAWAGGNLDVFGTNGAEQLTFLFGEASLDPSFNIGNDMLILDQASTDFTAMRMGSRTLLDSATTDLSIPTGQTGMPIEFANTTASLLYDFNADVIFIGSQMIDPTPMQLTFA